MNLREGFWFVGLDRSRVWSAAAAIAGGSINAGWLSLDHPAYLNFLTSEENLTLTVGFEQELSLLVTERLPGLITGHGGRKVDGVAFMARVTDDELTRIYAAADRDMRIRRWIEMLRMLGEIDLDGLTAQAAKAGLVAAGLLTKERADIIFA